MAEDIQNLSDTDEAFQRWQRRKIVIREVRYPPVTRLPGKFDAIDFRRNCRALLARLKAEALRNAKEANGGK